MKRELIIVAIFTAACSRHPVDGIDTPIITTTTQSSLSVSQIRSAVTKFADREHFMEEGTLGPRGQIRYAAKLSRRDMSMMIAARANEPIQIFAYAPDNLDESSRAHLKEVASAEVERLRAALTP